MKAALIVSLLALALSAHAWNPAECPQDCVFPEDFWAQHRPGGNPVYYWPNNSDQNKFPCGPKWVDVLASTSTDLWTLLAQEYIAARLNILSFSCIQYASLSQNLTNALYDAQLLLNGSTCVVSDQAQAWSAIAVLQDFNNGNGEVHTCLCPQSTQCPSCTQCPTCTPSPTEGCTSLVIQTCCQTPTPSSTPTPSTPTPSTPSPTCGACTRTQGYFKTHPEVWAGQNLITAFPCAPTDPLELLNTPSSGGNAYIILGRQYIAATLNVGLYHVCVDAVIQSALTAAASLLYNSSNCNPTGALRSDFITNALILDLFNNGLIGPGHCTDDLTPSVDETALVSSVYVSALEQTAAIDQAANPAGMLVPATIAIVAALLVHVL